MGGVEATRIIQAKVKPRETPYIVALTANAMEGDRDRFLADGFNEYLAKPLNIARLKEIIAYVSKSQC